MNFLDTYNNFFNDSLCCNKVEQNPCSLGIDALVASAQGLYRTNYPLLNSTHMLHTYACDTYACDTCITCVCAACAQAQNMRGIKLHMYTCVKYAYPHKVFWHETILLTTGSALSFIIYACRTILGRMVTDILDIQEILYLQPLVASQVCTQLTFSYSQLNAIFA